MESNRDEADKCLELAMKYVRQGNKEKAERFVRKAEKLFPSRRIQEVLILVSPGSMHNHFQVLNIVEQMGLGEEEIAISIDPTIQWQRTGHMTPGWVLGDRVSVELYFHH